MELHARQDLKVIVMSTRTVPAPNVLLMNKEKCAEHVMPVVTCTLTSFVVRPIHSRKWSTVRTFAKSIMRRTWWDTMTLLQTAIISMRIRNA